MALNKTKIKQALKPLKDKFFKKPQLSNVDYNRQLWDDYAKRWENRNIPLEDPNLSKKDIKVLGDEWGNKSDVQTVVRDFIAPYIRSGSIVGEIGTGGGRVASLIAPQVKTFYCFDISKDMLEKVKATLSSQTNVEYVLLKGPQFAASLQGTFDFIYSFDVFVHLDLHTIWKYFQEFKKALKPGGRVFVHTTNLKAPGGWERFCTQDEYRVEGHYFVTPEIIDVLAEHAGLKIIKRSPIDPTNYYYNRDYLLVMEKAA